jgi:redox-sensitive bicupin YhaK (pirin superfamily)
MIDGVFRHQDSNGGGGLITDGDTQWMTAGAGLSFALITLLTSTASSAFLSLPCAVPSKSN